MKKKCTKCPECGCSDFVNKDLVGDGYRECRSCGQEWWIDVDYSKPVLSRPLKFGDTEQIAALNSLEAGQEEPEYINGPSLTCAACGKVIGLGCPFCDDCRAKMPEGVSDGI